MTAKSFEELDHPCKTTCSGWQQGYEKGREFTLKESTDWKDEYDNLCKFATDFEQQRDALTAQLKEARECLEFYASANLLMIEFEKDGPFVHENGKRARAFLKKLEKGEG